MSECDTHTLRQRDTGLKLGNSRPWLGPRTHRGWVDTGDSHLARTRDTEGLVWHSGRTTLTRVPSGVIFGTVPSVQGVPCLDLVPRHPSHRAPSHLEPKEFRNNQSETVPCVGTPLSVPLVVTPVGSIPLPKGSVFPYQWPGVLPLVPSFGLSPETSSLPFLLHTAPS